MNPQGNKSQEITLNTKIRNASAIVLVGIFSMGLVACNTMSGLGKDTQTAGEKIEKEADRHIDDDKQ